MGIADNVLGRLTRSNPPHVKSGGQRGRFPVLYFGAHLLPGIGVLRLTVTLAMLALVGWGIADEMRTSHLEAWLFTGIDRGMSFAAQPGPSEAIRFPKHGP